VFNLLLIETIRAWLDDRVALSTWLDGRAGAVPSRSRLQVDLCRRSRSRPSGSDVSTDAAGSVWTVGSAESEHRSVVMMALSVLGQASGVGGTESGPIERVLAGQSGYRVVTCGKKRCAGGES
jgi:hypothetical protein